MDLETLQVIFDVNTAKVQPKLDALQKKFSTLFSKLGDGEDASKAVTDQISEMNQRGRAFMDKFETIMDQGSNKAAKAVTGNIKRMKTSTLKDVDSMMSEIDSKMESARAAQERMQNLKGMKSTALDSGDMKQASQLSEQAASAEARMTRYQNQAKALAQELKSEFSAIPTMLTKIAGAMDENESKIEAIRSKIKGLEIAEKDAMKLDPAKGFDAEPTLPTKQSKAIAEQIQKERSAMNKLIGSSDALNEQYAKLEDRSKLLATATDGLDTQLSGEVRQTKTLRESFAELSSQLRATAERAKSVMSTLGKITGLSRLSGAFKQLNNDSRGLMSRLTELGNRGSSSMNKMGSGARKADSQFKELSRGLKTLPAQFIVWGIGFEALQKFTEMLTNATKADKQFNNSLNQIKANLITAFYPLYATIMPWIDEFMVELEKATGWLAQFSAALFGMSNSAARSGAANLYKQTKAMSETSSATSAATKALQKQNAAITAHNKAMQEEVTKENAVIRAQNTARQKALQQENASIRSQNAKRKAAVEEANEKIKASNKAVAAAVAKQNTAQKKQIAELKKKYQDYKNSLMGFDEINTLDLSKDIPDYTPKTAKQQDLEKYTPKPTKASNYTATPMKTYTPEAKKTASTAGYVPDGVDDALTKPAQAFAGAAAAAKKLKDLLKNLWKPIKEAWDSEGAGVIKSFKYALGEIERLLGDIGKSFMTVWDSSTGVRVVKDILKLLQTVLGIIGDIAKAFAEAWEDHGAGTKLIRAIFDAFDEILKTLNAIGVSFRKAWNDGTGEKIAADLLKLFTDISKLIGSLAKSFREAWNEGDTGTNLFKAWLTAIDKIVRLADSLVTSFKNAWNEGGVGKDIFNNLLTIIGNIGKVIGNLAGGFTKAWESGKTGQGIFHTILGAVDDVLSDIKDMSSATATWAKKLDFRPLLTSVKGLFESVRGLNKTVWDGLDWAYKNILLPLAKFTITKALPTFFDLLSAAVKAVNSVLKALAPLAESLFNAFLKPFAKFTGGSGLGALKGITKALNGLADWIDKHQKAVQVFAKVLLGLFAVKVATSSFTKGIGFLADINDKLSLMKIKGPILKQLFNKITGLDKLKDAWKTLKGMTGLSWKKFSGGASSAKSLAGKSWSKLKDGAKYAGQLIGASWGKLKTAATTVVGMVKNFKNWSIWGKLAAGAQAALNAVMAVNPYVLLAAAITAVVVVFVELYKHNKKFRDFVNGIYRNIMKWLGAAIKWVKKNWKQIGSFILNPVGTIATWFLKDTKTGKNIQKWAKARLKDVTSWASSIGKNINKKVADGKKLAQEAGTKVGNWVSGFKTKATKTISTWAKGIGKTVSTGAASAKKLAQSAGTKIGGWVNGFRTKASKTIKTWATKLGSKVHDGISGAKKLAQKAGKTLGGWVNEFRTKASKTTKDWSKALGSKVHDGIKGAKSLANKAGTMLGGYVNAFRTKASTTAKNWAKGLGDKVHTGISGAKSLATKAGTKLGGWISDFRTKTGQTISKWAGGLGSKIGGGLGKGVDAVKRGAKKIAQGIVNIIGGAVNGVIDGIKWILRHVGASGAAGNLSHWNVPHFARGGVHQGGLAVVNDEDRENYQESFMLPNGQQGLFPKKRDLVTMLPYGTKIKTAADTERDIFKQLPHYAKGVSGTSWNFSLPTGNGSYQMSFGPVLSEVAQSVMNSVLSAVKGISGSNVLWDANHPKSIISQFTDKYDSFSSSNSLGTTLGKSANSVIRSGASSMVKDGLRHFADKALEKMHGIIDAAVNAYKRAVEAFKNMMSKLTGKKRKGKEFGGLVTEYDEYPLAEHNKPEMVLPLTKPRLALKYIDESLQRMGYTGTGVTMPTAMAKVNNGAVLPSNGSSSTQVKGDGVSGMQQAIVSSVMMAMTQQQGVQTATTGQPLEVTVKIGDETLGKHAIKGINVVNRKNGRNMLNL